MAAVTDPAAGDPGPGADAAAFLPAAVPPQVGAGRRSALVAGDAGAGRGRQRGAGVASAVPGRATAAHRRGLPGKSSGPAGGAAICGPVIQPFGAAVLEYCTNKWQMGRRP
jgi:hypothetical protein